MKSLYTAFIILIAFTANGQIPNGNFENWTAEIWTLNPDDWTTGNMEVVAPVTQEPDAFEGEYAMRVTAIPAELGEYGSAYTSFDLTSFPSTLDFQVKTACDAGAVAVHIAFKNEAYVVWEKEWFTSESIEGWTAVSLALTPPVEPIITSAEITVYASVGDFSPGSATIAIDAMSFDETLSIVTFEAANLQVYPNPAKKTINISNPELQISKLEMRDITGRQVKSMKVNSALEQIDVSNLKNGIYLLKADLKDGRQTVQKLVISR